MIAFQLSDLWRCSVILNFMYSFHLATNWYTKREFGVRKSFVKEVKYYYYISRRWTIIQNGGFYSVLCSFELNIDAGKYLKKIIPTAIYVFFLIWQIIIGLSVYYVIVNLTLIQGKYLRKKKNMFLFMWQIKS